MTKQEMVAYLTGLLTIMRDKEDAGRPVGNTLAQEYTKVYTQLREQIGKEHENEARSSEQRREREPQARADTQSG